MYIYGSLSGDQDHPPDGAERFPIKHQIYLLVVSVKNKHQQLLLTRFIPAFMHFLTNLVTFPHTLCNFTSK